MRSKSWLAMTAAVAALAVGLGSAAGAQTPSVKAAITTPKQAFGHEIGEDYFLASYIQATDYWKKLAGQSNRLKMVEIGKTTEGRPQYMMVISSPENLAKLDRYKEIVRKLSNPRGLSEAEARKLADEGRAIVWIDGGLHNTEVAHGQALTQLIYEMASRDDAETRRFLKDNILLAVHANPDGQEAAARYYMKEADPAKRPTNLFLPGIYPRYAGHDNNRDFNKVNLPETNNLTRQMYLEWPVTLFYNPHQSGPGGAVVFIPPYRNPVNPNIDSGVVTKLKELGASMESRLATEGKPGAAGGGEVPYGMWGGGAGTIALYHHGIVSLFTEIIGTPWPMEVPLVAERQIKTTDIPNPVPPQTWHMSQTIDYQISLERAVMDYGSRNRDRLLYDTYVRAKRAIEAGEKDSWTISSSRIDALKSQKPLGRDAGAVWYTLPTDKARNPLNVYDTKLFDTVLHDPQTRDPRGYILSADQPDFPTAVELVNSLMKTGVEAKKATAPFTVAGKTYPAGSLVVMTGQPYRGFLLDMMEAQDYPHDTQYPGGPPIPPYDMAGYTMAYQMGSKVDRVYDGFEGPFAPVTAQMPVPAATVSGVGNAGYLIPHEVLNAFTLTNRLLKAKTAVYWLKAGVSADGKTFAPGAIWVPHTAASKAIVAQAAKELGVPALAVAAAPSAEKIALKPVRVGVVDKYGGLMPSGWVQFMFNRFEMPYQVVYPKQVDAGDLGKSFDVVILTDETFPSSRDRTPASVDPIYAAQTGSLSEDKSVAALRGFVEGGGTLIASGGAAKIGEALGVSVDALTETVDGKTKPLTRSKFYIPGSLLKASVDNTQPLAYGFGRDVDVMFDESPVFTVAPSAKAAKVAWYSGKAPLRSGWAWGQERLDGKQAIADVSLGKGRVFLLAPEVTHRGQTFGTFNFLFNATLYGPVARP